jgi:heme A synthase
MSIFHITIGLASQLRVGEKMDTQKVLQNTQKGFRNQGIGMIVMLVIQYILGMITNLFVEFPKSDQEGKLWEFAWSQIPEAFHIILGLLMFVSAVVFLIRAFSKRDKIWIIGSGIGLIAILMAIIGGVIFIPSQVDSYSLIMALSFIVSFLAYSWGLYASKH